MSDDPQRPADAPAPGSPPRRPRTNYARQMAIATELPFTLVVPILIAGAIGYFADRWLGTAPILMLGLAGLGFYAGVREVYRRYLKMFRSSDDQPRK